MKLPLGGINVNQIYTKWVIGLLLHFSFRILNFPIWVLRKVIKVVTEDQSKSEYDSALLKLPFFFSLFVVLIYPLT